MFLNSLYLEPYPIKNELTVYLLVVNTNEFHSSR